MQRRQMTRSLQHAGSTTKYVVAAIYKTSCSPPRLRKADCLLKAAYMALEEMKQTIGPADTWSMSGTYVSGSGATILWAAYLKQLNTLPARATA